MFFDIKLILIIILIVIIYFLHRDISKIKEKVNSLIHNVSLIHKTIPKEEKTKMLADKYEEIFSSDHEIHGEHTEMYQSKTPFNFNNPFDIFNFDSFSPIKIIKIPLNASEKITCPLDITAMRLTNQPVPYTHIMTDIKPIVVEEKHDTKLNTILEEDTTINQTDSKIQSDKYSDEWSEDNEDTQVEEDDETSTGTNTGTHLEVYSNDSVKEVLSNTQATQSPKLKSNTEDYKKNLSKYKLPELQDIAIEYKIEIKKDGKNKTKVDLINDLKKIL
jgi:hypothetical protein